MLSCFAYVYLARPINRRSGISFVEIEVKFEIQKILLYCLHPLYHDNWSTVSWSLTLKFNMSASEDQSGDNSSVYGKRNQDDCGEDDRKKKSRQELEENQGQEHVDEVDEEEPDYWDDAFFIADSKYFLSFTFHRH